MVYKKKNQKKNYLQHKIRVLKKVPIHAKVKHAFRILGEPPIKVRVRNRGLLPRFFNTETGYFEYKVRFMT